MGNDRYNDETRLISIPSLSKTTWIEWIDFIESYFRSRGLWALVNGEEETPIDEKEGREREKRQFVALSFIKSAVGAEQRQHLIGIQDAAEALIKLRAVNEVETAEQVQSLLLKFFNFKALDSIDLTASRLTQIQMEIGAASLEDRPSDTVKKTILINCLRPQYITAIYALKVAGLSALSYDNVVSRLKEVEIDSGKQRPRNTEDLARIARQRPRNHPNRNRMNRGNHPNRDRINQGSHLNDNRMKRGNCYECGDPGHFAKDCRVYRANSNNDDKEVPRNDTARYAAFSAMFSNERPTSRD